LKNRPQACFSLKRSINRKLGIISIR
jgi:hypothetical protein